MVGYLNIEALWPFSRSASDVKTPQARAAALLAKHFPERSIHENGHEYIAVRGSKSGVDYCLFVMGCGFYSHSWTRGYCVNGHVWFDDSHTQPDYRIPREDTVLACALLIKYDEPTFLSIANWR